MTKNEHLLRETKSICPVCFEIIDAFVLEQAGKVILVKECAVHGKFELVLSRTPGYYRQLDCFYFGLMKKKMKNFDYEIWPTLRCNMNCNICFYGGQRKKLETAEPSVGQIADFVKKDRHKFYCLSGAEATCRDDLEKIIKCLRNHGKEVALNTNGLKLTDFSYVKKLKDAGLGRVVLQFDGFAEKYYEQLRGENVLNAKLEALDNLKRLKVPTVLCSTIARKINEDLTAELIDFAVKNSFINGVSFLTLSFDGGARNFSLDNYIMPDEVVDIVVEHTKGKIAKKDVFIFQKLHLAIKSFLSQRYCFYNQLYLVLRSGKGYEPIGSFLNLAAAEPWLDRYRRSFESKNGYSGVYLFAALLAACLNKKIIFLFSEIIICSLSYFLRTGRYLKTKKLISLSFTTGCDPYKYDLDILTNCQNEIITADETGKLVCLGREGKYFVDLERRFMQNERDQQKIRDSVKIV